MSDVERARHYFRSVCHREFFLTATAAAPLNLLHPRVGSKVTAWLQSLDELVFRVTPLTRRYAWITRIELRR